MSATRPNADRLPNDPSPATSRAGVGSGALIGLLLFYAMAAVAVGYQRTVLSHENNFLIFRAAFEHLMAGQDLYAPWPGVHEDFFKYSPTFAFLFAPFALLPVTAGYMLWALSCAAAVCWGFVRLLPARQAYVALAIALLPVVGDLQRAQSNALCAGLMLLAWTAYERRAQWSVASAIAAGTFVKLFPAAAFAGAIFHPRKLRMALIATATAILGVALPLVAVSPTSLASQYRSWHAIETRDAAPLARYGAGGADLYAGLMGQFRVWWGVDWPHWPTQLAGVIVLLLPLAVQWKRRDEPHFRLLFLSSILVFCVLFNHQAESPSFVIAMVGMALWYAVSPRTGWRTGLMLVAFAVVNLGSTDLMPRAWYRAYYVPYLLKTVPLIPLWIVMQAELLGLVANVRPASEGGEVDQGDVASRQARTNRR
mgnify:FL=1